MTESIQHEATKKSEKRADERSAAKDPSVEREKMRVMGLWLDAACAELDVDRAIIDKIRGPMLGLISDVAHGPSRPGAPMTALVVGLASQPSDNPEQILDRIARLIALAQGWQAPAASEES